MSDERTDRLAHVRQTRRSRQHDGEVSAGPRRAEPEAASREAAPGSTPDTIEQLQAERDEARREAAEARAAWQRSAADFANFKRRSEQERLANLGLANESLLRKLLAVADDFDRALATLPADLEQQGWVEGITLVERKLRTLLESEGVTPIEAVGKPFDPREHEAISHAATDSAPDGVVLAEHQRGYRLRDRVLRPSLVTVANNPNTEAGTNTSAAPGGDH